MGCRLSCRGTSFAICDAKHNVSHFTYTLGNIGCNALTHLTACIRGSTRKVISCSSSGLHRKHSIGWYWQGVCRTTSIFKRSTLLTLYLTPRIIMDMQRLLMFSECNIGCMQWFHDMPDLSNSGTRVITRPGRHMSQRVWLLLSCSSITWCSLLGCSFSCAFHGQTCGFVYITSGWEI